MVTFIRCILFVSTIIGFILKNPLFSYEVINGIDVEFMDINLKILKMNIIIEKNNFK